jgi:cytochrome b involved in lipid metabolism
MGLAVRISVPCVDITVDHFYVNSTTVHSFLGHTRQGTEALQIHYLNRKTQTDLKVDKYVLHKAFKAMLQMFED